MLEKPLLDILKQNQEWKKLTDLSSSILINNPAIDTWRSLTSTLQSSGLAETLSLAKGLYSSSLANWLPEPRTIKANPLLWDQFTDLFPKQISLTDSLNEALRNIDIPGPLRSIQSSLYDLSGKVSGMAFRRGDTTWLDTFEHVNVQAKTMVDAAAAHPTVTKQDLNNLQEFVSQSIESIKVDIRKGAKSPMAIISFFITLLSLVLSAWPIIADKFKAPGERNATKHDIELVRDAIVSRYDVELAAWVNKSEIRVTCAVRERPFKGSLILKSLKKGYSVTVINTSHRWANISYFDDNNWPVTGWVLKKYLIHPATRGQGPKTLRLIKTSK